MARQQKLVDDVDVDAIAKLEQQLSLAQRRIAVIERALTRMQQELVAYHKKIAAVIEEIDQLLINKETSGQQAKRLLDFYVDRWEKKYGEKPIVHGGRDMKQLKGLLQALTAREIATRLVAYLGTSDDYVASRKHPLGLFVTTVNRYGAALGETTVNAVIQCDHTPRCKTETEHTRRHMADMRTL